MPESDRGAAPRFYTPAQIQDLLHCSRGYVYTLIKRNGFPKPIHLSQRCRRWNADDVDAWMQRQAGGRP